MGAPASPPQQPVSMEQSLLSEVAHLVGSILAKIILNIQSFRVIVCGPGLQSRFFFCFHQESHVMTQ